MNDKVLDLAKDKKIGDFAKVVKDELRKKLMKNDYIASQADELQKYQTVSDTMKQLRKEVE
jgi:hypothetical protein